MGWRGKETQVLLDFFLSLSPAFSRLSLTCRHKLSTLLLWCMLTGLRSCRRILMVSCWYLQLLFFSDWSSLYTFLSRAQTAEGGYGRYQFSVLFVCIHNALDRLALHPLSVHRRQKDCLQVCSSYYTIDLFCLSLSQISPQFLLES